MRFGAGSGSGTTEWPRFVANLVECWDIWRRAISDVGIGDVNSFRRFKNKNR